MHYMFGYTRVHRDDGYGAQQDFYGSEFEEMDNYEE